MYSQRLLEGQDRSSGWKGPQPLNGNLEPGFQNGNVGVTLDWTMSMYVSGKAKPLEFVLKIF